MKILFVNPTFFNSSIANRADGTGVDIHWGLSAMSALLKKNGHETAAVHFDWYPTDDELLSEIEGKKSGVDIIGIGFTFHQQTFVKEWVKLIKDRFKRPIILGGLYPSMKPDEVISWEGVNYICRAEGEYPLLELLNSLEKRDNNYQIPSIWFKKDDGSIVKNDIRPIENSLDDLPYYDYSLFDLGKTNVARKRIIPIMYLASRGCPFSCTYCANHAIRSLYPNPGKFIRFQSVDRVIDELKILIEKTPYEVKTITFADINFNFKKKWVLEFCQKYKKEFKIPYRCTIRLDLMNNDLAEAFAESGCYRLSYGLESGNERLRNEILKRPWTNERMLEQALNIHRTGMQTTSSNLVGVPEETLEMCLETVKFNAKAKVDTAQISIFCPHPNTALKTLCEEKGYIDYNKHIEDEMCDTILNLDTITPAEIRYAHRVFRSAVAIYQKIYSMPKWIQSVLEPTVDRIYLSKMMPRDFVVKVHDNYFKEWLLTRQYRRLELPMLKQLGIDPS